MGNTEHDYLKTEDYKRTEAGNFSPENPPPEYTEKDEERKQEILRGAFHGTELDYLADKKENWEKWLAGEFANDGQVPEANAQSDTECPDEEVASSSIAMTEAVLPARSAPLTLPANFDMLSLNDKKVAVQTQMDWHANETKNLKNMMTALNKELRSEDIRVNVLLPSGRSMPVTVKPKMTIKAVKQVLEDNGVGEVAMIRLVVGNDEAKNSRTVSGLGLSNGDTMTMILSLVGGGKGTKVKQDNFMKVAKRMEAQSHMDKSKDTAVGSVKTTNDACTALMNASDTNAKHAMRLLLNENDCNALQQAIDGVNASNNRDARLHECAEALFGRLIQRLKDDMAEYTGAIETCHCTFQTLGIVSKSFGFFYPFAKKCFQKFWIFLPLCQKMFPKVLEFWNPLVRPRMMMNDAFVQGGRWDWKSFVTMMQEVMGEKQRSGAGAITSINME
eukprot:Skav225827  [mRNA]  locus=scaffold2516:68957:70294:+ [translate_table: standard]